MSQTLEEACTTFVGWLDAAVTKAGRGDDTDRLGVAPAATFWLGRLASQQEVAANPIGDRAERLDPCAIGIRLRPVGPGPWRIEVTARCRAWFLEDPETATDPERPWRRTPLVEVTVPVLVQPDRSEVTAGTPEFETKFTTAGVRGLSATVRVDVESWHGEPELVVQLVNTSPATHAGIADTHLYETQLDVSGLPSRPFLLESLPDSFRYDRAVPAYGVNVGVIDLEGVPGGFRTTDTVAVQSRRPVFWNSPTDQPDLTFATLATQPIPSLTALVEALEEYHDTHWSSEYLSERGRREGWDAPMREEARRAADSAGAEVTRLRRGLQLLVADATVRRAFCLMNLAIAHSAAGKYHGWRPFQLGFLLSTLPFLVDPSGEGPIVDTVWFATGGGKTETYLGLLVTAALYDRMTGKHSGVTAWSRFPLRLLSLQQTQRFADALAGAELVRQAEGIKGAPMSLGFLVGRGGTPNKVVKTAEGEDPGPDSPGMPDRYQVLLRCPFCRGDDVHMRFDRRLWRLAHQCHNESCPWPHASLPVYVVDQEVHRYLPTVVLGTLDKAASVSLQAAMRGLVGPPVGICSNTAHGYTYAPRSKTPQGCLVPDCDAPRAPLPMAKERYAPTLRLQDELHLLRDSLGAVDSHYESLLDHLQEQLGGPRCKIIASSATLTGYEHQVEVLYRRAGRVFPEPGPASRQSFWSRLGPEAMRRFIAVAPRGVTLDHVSDRTLDVLQTAVRELHAHPDEVCAQTGIDSRHVTQLLSLYGTDVVYGSTLYDVEAATRSLANNTSSEGINAVQLTGQTDFDEVRHILERLEHPEEQFKERIHVVTASSMLSHGVDIERLNTMVMLGLPLSTAEFIQTTARVGRRYPGLVYVLHKIARERDAATFRHFEQFVTHGDRFVEAIPVTRRSRRVLRLTLPGIVEARRLMVMEPASVNKRLTTIRAVKEYVRDAEVTVDQEVEVIAELLGCAGPEDDLLRQEVRDWIESWFTNLHDPASTRQWPNELGPGRPMISLRDVEVSVPIRD